MRDVLTMVVTKITKEGGFMSKVSFKKSIMTAGNLTDCSVCTH